LNSMLKGHCWWLTPNSLGHYMVMEFSMTLITNLMCKEECLWHMDGLMLLDRKDTAWKLWIQDTVYQFILKSVKWRTIEGDGKKVILRKLLCISIVIKQLLILWRTLISCCIVAYFSCQDADMLHGADWLK
jgi:hypothetical protein